MSDDDFLELAFERFEARVRQELARAHLDPRVQTKLGNEVASLARQFFIDVPAGGKGFASGTAVHYFVSPESITSRCGLAQRDRLQPGRIADHLGDATCYACIRSEGGRQY